ncbi:MAG: hypothetical protein DLM52_10165 [Chthoniobacterales bacterium]|nr:MAG: hypothetical protein DLM52_10165 [Chthoniobacterales bacterium]
MIRVVLPAHLRTLAQLSSGEVELKLDPPATPQKILDALESSYPVLRGTIRDHTTQLRRPLVRFFACGEDVSHSASDSPLPEAISNGIEPFFVIGAIAGG